MKYMALLNKEKHGFGVSFPDFPDCTTFGADEEEAVDMAHEALAMFVELQVESGVDLPEAMSKQEVLDLPDTKNKKVVTIEVSGEGTDFEAVELTLHRYLLERIEQYADKYGVAPADFLAVAAREAMRKDVFKE